MLSSPELSRPSAEGAPFSDLLVIMEDGALSELVAAHLRHLGHLVLAASSAADASRWMAEVKPDLVVLDGDMPSALDPDLLATLQGEGRDDVRTGRPCNTANHLAKPQDVAVPVVLLQSSQLPVGGLRPSRRITKPYSPKALAKTVHSVLVEARDARAGARRAANRLRAGGLELDIDQHSVERVGSTPKQRADLPPTEWRLLHHLMREPGRTHTRAEIRSAVWGDHAAVDERTVDQSVRRLRAVLAQLQAENALQTVRGLGYRIEPLPDRDRA